MRVGFFNFEGSADGNGLVVGSNVVQLFVLKYRFAFKLIILALKVYC